MTFDKRSLRTVCAALSAATQWEESLADAYCHMKTNPVYRKALLAARKYSKLRLRIVKELTSERSKL